MEHLTNMDGGVLIDPQGQCHAIGVILDGTASRNGDPARGSRYNNAIRYIDDSDTPPAVVLGYSSDGDITILPALNPRRRRSDIEALVQRYVTACSASPPRQQAAAAAENRINDVRFYLSADQCTRINRARADLNTWRQANHEIVHTTVLAGVPEEVLFPPPCIRVHGRDHLSSATLRAIRHRPSVPSEPSAGSTSCPATRASNARADEARSSRSRPSSAATTAFASFTRAETSASFAAGSSQSIFGLPGLGLSLPGGRTQES